LALFPFLLVMLVVGLLLAYPGNPPSLGSTVGLNWADTAWKLTATALRVSEVEEIVGKYLSQHGEKR
jgi:hypothetical protein